MDEEGRLINQKRCPALATVVPDAANGRLGLRFPDGTRVAEDVRLGATVTTAFYGRPVQGRLLEGPWSEALSVHAGTALRLVRAEFPGDALDRGGWAGVSLISIGSLRALAAKAGRETVDPRRFRMTLTLEGLEPHGEDAWLGRRVRAGSALLDVEGNVGRCAVTTRDPDTGVRDLETLDLIEAYRRDVPTTEPLPFGVWSRVVEPGSVAMGDVAEPVIEAMQRRALLDQAALDGPARELVAARELQLAQHRRDVALDRLHRQVEAGGDLLVAVAARDQLEHLAFSCRQQVQLGVARRLAGAERVEHEAGESRREDGVAFGDAVDGGAELLA